MANLAGVWGTLAVHVVIYSMAILIATMLISDSLRLGDPLHPLGIS